MRKFSVLIVLVLLINSCYKESAYDKDSPGVNEVILNAWTARKDIYASGSDTTLVFVQLPVEAKDAAAIVSFKTNSGQFIETTKSEAQATATLSIVNGESLKIAKVTYQASKSADSINIDVKVSGYQRTIILNLKPVLADSLRIIPSALSIRPDFFSEINIIASLKSINGSVTPGQFVSLTVLDTMNLPKGSFRLRNDRSNDNGECNFIYTVAPDTSYRGRLMIRVLANANNSQLKDSINIFVAK